MLRYLVLINAGMAILAAMMAVGVGIAALLMWAHVDNAPRIAEDMASLTKLTVAYAAVLAASIFGLWALLRRPDWPFARQALPQLAFGFTVYCAYRVSVALLFGA
jgi:hypothetical protein